MKSLIHFSKKKKEKGQLGGGEEGWERGSHLKEEGEAILKELKVAKKVREEFMQAINGHFHWFEPGLADLCKVLFFPFDFDFFFLSTNLPNLFFLRNIAACLRLIFSLIFLRAIRYLVYFPYPSSIINNLLKILYNSLNYVSLSLAFSTTEKKKFPLSHKIFDCNDKPSIERHW